MPQLLLGDFHPISFELLNRPLQIHRVPQSNGRNYQIETTRPVRLVFKRAILDLPQPMQEDRSGQGITGFAFLQP